MYSIEDRSQVITIGGVEHKLILTTKATKDITSGMAVWRNSVTSC